MPHLTAHIGCQKKTIRGIIKVSFQDTYYGVISSSALELVKEFGPRDPFAIAKGLGIEILYVPFEKLKGVYKIINDVGFVFLNENNCRQLNKVVLAHELGHHILHNDFARQQAFSDDFLFGENRRKELEANLFAAELLLHDRTVVEEIKGWEDIMRIATITETDQILVAMKCALLIKKGYPFIPQEYDTVFLK